MGTTANNQGFYSLQLAPGTYRLLCQHVGYKTVEKELVVKADDIILNMELTEQQYDLKEIVIKSNAEDPAYEIIRNAIRKREEHLKEIKEFQCEVYTKGQLRLRDFPKKFMGNTVDFEDGDTSKKKILFLSETVAKYARKQPDKSKTEIISTRVSGNSDGFGLANPQIISFYENIVQLGRGLNPRGFISPIANNAIGYYKYKYEGTFFENGIQINHIKVMPRRAYEPLFHGYINIVENEWRIHSVQLELLKTSQMQLLDTLKIDQLYVPAGNVWVIKQQVIYPAGKLFAFDFYGSFVQVYDKFNLQPVFPKNYFNNTVLKVSDSSNKKTKQYWDSTRPIPILDDEATDFKKKDSLEQVRKDPKYLDSLDKKANKPTTVKILLSGYTYTRRKSKLNLSFDPLLDVLNFNTAEGTVVNFSPTINKSYEGRRSWSITPVFRYGFSNQRVNAHINGNYNFGKKYAGTIGGSFGNQVFQFNNAQPITPRMNTYSTLNWRNNFMKIYEAGFARINYSKSLGAGFTLRLQGEYQNRRPLENTTNYSWRKLDNKPYSPNYPEEITNQNILPHQALAVSLGFTWRPGMKYMELPNQMVGFGSKYPTFSFNLVKGVKDLFGSDVDYTKWRFSMTDNLNLKLGGRINYRLVAGGFLQAKNVFLPDYIHFQGNRQNIASPYLNSFQLMNYYGFSNTASLYAAGHLEYHLNGLLTNKIPFFKKLNWFMVTGTNSLFINKDRYHAEVFVGIENILKIFRIDFIYGWQRQQQVQGIRFSLPLFITGGTDD
jgi:hypothetical protein